MYTLRLPKPNSWFILLLSFASALWLNVPHASASGNAAHLDYDGDGKADFAFRIPNQSRQLIRRSSDGEIVDITFGRDKEDIPVTGDFDGDGKADIAVRRPSTKMWYILNSSGVDYLSNFPDGISRVKFGLESTDIPVLADYDGDGRTDIAVRRPRTQYWYVLNSSGIDPISNNTDAISRIRFGKQVDDIPVPADYDGDGKADIAVRRPSTKVWYIRNSSGVDALTSHVDGISRFTFGFSSDDTPVPADYDGDGKADLAYFRVTGLTYSDSNEWYSALQWKILNSGGVDLIGENGTAITEKLFGVSRADIPVVADYDGDGRADLALRFPNQYVDWHAWFVNNSTGIDPVSSNPDGVSVLNYFGNDKNYPPLGITNHNWKKMDLDNDRLTNGEEVTLGSLPMTSDSDGDGFIDGAEIEMGTDPVDAASTFDMTSLNIPDEVLHRCITQHRENEGQISYLYCSDKAIRDLDGIAGIPGLRSINLGYTLVTDLGPLSSNPTLEEIHIREGKVTTLSTLSNLPSLRYLDVYWNQVNDISGMSGFPSLETVDLGDNEIDNISVLDNFPSIRNLYLHHNNISDISSLSALSNLEELGLTSNNVTNITPLAGLTKITDLGLSGNNVSDISTLAELTSLRFLRLSKNDLTHIDALFSLINLRVLELFDNEGIKCADIEALKVTLPNTSIHSTECAP